MIADDGARFAGIFASRRRARVGFGVGHMTAPATLQALLRRLLDRNLQVVKHPDGFDVNAVKHLLEHFERLLTPGGSLISANLFLGQYAPDLPGLEQTAEYRMRILDANRWLTAYLPDGTAISIRR